MSRIPLLAPLWRDPFPSQGSSPRSSRRTFFPPNSLRSHQGIRLAFIILTLVYSFSFLFPSLPSPCRTCPWRMGARLAGRCEREKHRSLSLGDARETERCSRLRGSRATDRGRESLLGAERLKSVLLLSFSRSAPLFRAPYLAPSHSRSFYHVPASISLLCSLSLSLSLTHSLFLSFSAVQSRSLSSSLFFPTFVPLWPTLV